MFSIQLSQASATVLYFCGISQGTFSTPTPPYRATSIIMRRDFTPSKSSPEITLSRSCREPRQAATFCPTKPSAFMGSAWPSHRSGTQTQRWL